MIISSVACFMLDNLYFFTVFCMVLIVLFKWTRWYTYSYWSLRQVTQLNPEFFFGDQKEAWKGLCSKTELFLRIYQQFKEKGVNYGGFYMLYKPYFMPINPKLVKDIVKTHFEYFQDHGVYHHPKDVLFENVFTLEGEKWNDLRKKLGPLFRQTNIKVLFEHLLDKFDRFSAIIDEEYVVPKTPININTMLDELVNSTYGFAPGILENRNKKYKNFGDYIFNPRSYWCAFEQIIPWSVLGHFGHKASSGKELEKKFIDTFTKFMKERRDIYDEPPKDFMSLFLHELNIRNKKDNSKPVNNIRDIDEYNYILSKEEIISHSFLFLASGFETSATSATFVFYDLAQNKDIQDKLRNEINQVLFNYDNQMTWEALNDMKYLDQVVKESLRHHPPFARIARKCTKDYKIPNTNVLIEKGTKIIIPMWGLHMDPEYFPMPEVFDPEHFLPENVAKRPECTFFPFGEGKRTCLGQKLGLMQIKLIVSMITRSYSFGINNMTKLPIKMTAFTIISKIKGDLWLDIRRINDDTCQVNTELKSGL